MKFIIVIAIICAVVTQSGCLSHRAARYAVRHGSAAVKNARAESRSREYRRAEDARAAQEENRPDSQTVPLTPRDDGRSDFR